MTEQRTKTQEECDIIRNAEERLLLARFRQFDETDKAIILIKAEQMAESAERLVKV